MTLTADDILLLLAIIAFGLAAVGVSVPRIHVGWLGAALAAVAVLVSWHS